MTTERKSSNKVEAPIQAGVHLGSVTGALIVRDHQAVNNQSKQKQKHTTEGIRWWSPTQLLTSRRVA